MCAAREIDTEMTSQELAIHNSIELLERFRDKLTPEQIERWEEEIKRAIEIKQDFEEKV
jgi:hypothetical protein